MMSGLERIKVLSSEIKDKPLLKIVEYLLSRKDMDEKYNNEEKTLKEMVSYIKSLAQKEAKDGMAIIEDEVVYGWAIHYFDEPNEALGLSSNVEQEKEIKKPVEQKKEIKPEGSLQLSLFDL